jgi:DNA helicase HerA-like ATPase
VDQKIIDAAKQSFPSDANAVVLGAVTYGGETHAEPIARIPLSVLNRHGLIAGATGTGKTKTLQLLAEQLSAAGVPVFIADIKGDLQGLAAPGVTHEKIDQRAADTGFSWTPTAYPVEFLSLTGRSGAQVRATVSSFGPLLLAKVLDLNETQTSVLTLVFEYCDKNDLLLLDFTDLRAVLDYLSGDGAAQLKSYGGMSKQTVGVLARKMIELERQGANDYFGEPAFDLDDLLRLSSDRRGIVSVLELNDVQESPAIFSTFLLWLLASLFNDLPEVGDVDKPKLVFFFDEAHLLFEGASKALREQIEQVVRLVRSKGVGVFFVTQNPRDVDQDVLAQLGHRIQHALRAFTPNDEKTLRAAAKTFPKTSFYDIEETLTTLGIGEALVSVLGRNGVPTQPFAVKLVPPTSRMSPLSEAELKVELQRSAQVGKYATDVDRESAREILAKRVQQAPAQAPAPAPSSRRTKEPTTVLEQVLKSPVTRTVAGAITRGLMGALVGRRRR